MKLFTYNKDNDPDMPDWQWGFFCFKPLDILTVKIYKMKQYTWKECFNFTFTFFDYSLLDFSLTVGNYDLLITFLNFSGSRSLNYQTYHTYHTYFNPNK